MNKNADFIILIAEDNEGHAILIHENLRTAGVYSKIISFKNGKDVYDYFLTNSNNIDNVNYLVLLDINMPKMDGKELLKRMREDKKLNSIPVVMLTNTDDPEEIQSCYELGCNEYITKPIEQSKFSDTLKRLGFL